MHRWLLSGWEWRLAGKAPGCENLVDGWPHPVAGSVAGQAGYEQCVVTGVLVAYRCGHGSCDGGFIQDTACCGPAYPAAAPQAGVPGDDCGTLGRASREQAGDLVRQAGLEILVRAGAPYPVACAAPRPGVLDG